MELCVTVYERWVNRTFLVSLRNQLPLRLQCWSQKRFSDHPFAGKFCTGDYLIILGSVGDGQFSTVSIMDNQNNEMPLLPLGTPKQGTEALESFSSSDQPSILACTLLLLLLLMQPEALYRIVH